MSLKYNKHTLDVMRAFHNAQEKFLSSPLDYEWSTKDLLDLLKRELEKRWRLDNERV